MENTFLIPEENLGALDERLARLNRKAKKLGVEPVVTRVLSVNWKEISESFQADDDSIRTVTRTVRFYEIEVLGVAPKLPGYTFLGTLQHTDGGNIIRSFEGAEIDTSFRSVAAKCDHCKMARRRKDTYLVKKDSGEVLQVGHNCVADFLGGVSPERIAFMASVIRELGDLTGSEGGSFGGKRVIYLDAFLSYVSELIKENGWVSASAARAYAEKSEGKAHITPAASDAIHHMFPSKQELREGFKPVNPSQESREEAKKVIEWAKTLNGTSDYEYNLSAVCKLEIIEHRNTGLAASAVAAYQREVLKQKLTRERNKSFAERFANSTFQGTVGERKEWTLTVNKIITLPPSDYGYSNENRYLYSMEDEQGNVFVWLPSSGRASLFTMTEEEAKASLEMMSCAYRHTTVEVEEGDKITLKGTVKEHKVYREIKQTALSRCTVLSIAGHEEAAARAVKTVKEVTKRIEAQEKAEKVAAQANEKEAS